MSLKKWILAGAGFLVLLVLAAFLLKPAPPPPIKLPNPNGYDDLVKAGQMFVGQTPDCNLNNAECIQELKTFLAKNEKAIELARLGLSRESRVPIGRTNPVFAILKSVALTFQAEGQIAEKENRLDDAIKSYLDMIRLSQQIQGGTIMDSIFSLALEAVGMKPLQEIADKMTTDQRRRVIKALVDVDSKRLSFDEVMRMAKIYADKTHTLKARLSDLRYFFSVRDVERTLETKIKYRQARNGLLLVDLAVRNYQAETNHPPKGLKELVPKYLPFLPKDNFSGNDFIYHPQSNSFVLYGVGPDGKDDGGKPIELKGDVWPGDMLPNSGY